MKKDKKNKKKCKVEKASKIELSKNQLLSDESAEYENVAGASLSENDELIILKDIEQFFGGYKVRKGDVVKFLHRDSDGDLIVEKENGDTIYIKPSNARKKSIPYSAGNEMNLDFNLKDETQSLFEEIMDFHKEVHINNCLENGNYEAIKNVI